MTPEDQAYQSLIRRFTTEPYGLPDADVETWLYNILNDTIDLLDSYEPIEPLEFNIRLRAIAELGAKVAAELPEKWEQHLADKSFRVAIERDD